MATAVSPNRKREAAPKSVRRWVYRFDEVDEAQNSLGGSWDKTRALLGGKGAGLGDMTRAGVPVPPGFTVTTEACNAYLAAGGEFPDGTWTQVTAALKAVEDQTGKCFGDPGNPLLLSVRSGAKFSMPGMMDTVLNLGMNDEVAAGMVKLTDDERFLYDVYRRLVQMFGCVVLNIAHDLGTAVNVQTMVFGNMGEGSGTGVAFTRNPATGEKKLFGCRISNILTLDTPNMDGESQTI